MSKDLLQISEILDDYYDDIKNSVNEVIAKVGDKGVNDLKNNYSTYKVRTGKYNKGWKAKLNVNNSYSNLTIYNTQYMLTHLLEDGHLTRNGKRTRAFPHINPEREKLEKEVETKIQEIIRRGGK